MAEIKVERKEQTPIWPWIIGILVLIGLIWFLVEALSDDEPEYQEDQGQVEEVGDATLLIPAEKPESMHLTDFSQA